MVEISLKDIHKFYGANHVLKGISCEINQGEKIGLLGKNGAGKTTLFKVMSGEEVYDNGSIMISKESIIGSLDQMPVFPDSYSVTDVLKSAFASLFEIRKNMEGLENLMANNSSPKLLEDYGKLQYEFEHAGGYSIDEMLSRVTQGLNIDKWLQSKKFNLLSGGEKTRACLARLILQKPDILLLDEPTNHLDLSSIRWLEGFLIDFKGTVIIISHDRYFLDKVVKRIIEISDGTTSLYEGNYSYYVKEKEERYLSQLACYEQEQKKVKQLREAAERLHEWANNADNPALHKRAFAMERRIGWIEKTEKPTKDRKLLVDFKEERFSGKDVITIERLSKIYNNRNILDSIDIVIKRNECVAILGDNGSGKSTLIKILIGEIEADSGTAHIGSSIRAAYLPQEIKFEHPERTIMDTIRHALIVSEQEARRLLARFEFKGEDVIKKVENLSGGEKSRLKLCILMQDKINMLLLDEPTNHLDIQTREWMETILSDFGGSIIFISHDRYFINKFATRIMEIANGKISNFFGTFDEYTIWKSENNKSESVNNKLCEQVINEQKAKKVSDNSKNTLKRLEQERLLLENEIVELEGKLKELEQCMEEHTSDFEMLNQLFREKESVEWKIEKLYEKWEDVSS